MNLAEAFRSEVDDHVGHVVADLVPAEEPGLTELVRLFGGPETPNTNAHIAAAGGYGAAREHARGTPEWRKRQTFLRNLQRYRTPESVTVPAHWTPDARRRGVSHYVRERTIQRQRRTPKAKLEELRTIARREQRRLATPNTRSEVLDFMGRYGVTMRHVSGKFSYQPGRQRQISVSVGIEPDVFGTVGWPEEPNSAPAQDDLEGWLRYALDLLSAWAIAYGIPDVLVADGMDEESNTDMEFDLGVDEEASYHYGAA